MSNEIAHVCSYLNTKAISIPCDNEWLTSCVECFKSQGVGNIKDLKELVFQQWLLADLSDIAVPSFPLQCLTADKIILTGKYSVQLNYVVNIGISFHKQLSKIRRPEAQNNLEIDCEIQATQQFKYEKENSGTRILKMEITDGVNTVLGFEDQFIPILQEPIVPGKKAILRGPIECRKGVLFLRPSNVSILGGEVDTLHISNATENILARALRLPANPDPYKQHIVKEEREINGDCLDEDDEALMIVAAAIESEAPNNSSRTEVHQNMLEAQSCYNFSVRTNDVRSSSHSSKSCSSNPFISNENECNYDFDDDFDITTAQAESLVDSSPDFSSNRAQESKKFDPISNQKCVEEMKKLKKDLEESYGGLSWANKVNLDLPRPKEAGKIWVDCLTDSESILDTINNIDESHVIPRIETEENQINGDTSTFPPKEYPSTVKVSGKIIKILKKPKLKGDKWCVSALVAVKGIELEASFSSEAVDKIFTVSAKELLDRREQLKYNMQMKEEMNQTLKESQQRFSKLNCDMVFRFNDRISNPVVIDILNNG